MAPDPKDDSDQPVVGYTVKELIARMEGKLDAYAKRQDSVVETVSHMATEVRDHGQRLVVLETSALSKSAVRTWQSNVWRGVVSVTGVMATAAVILQLAHVFH